MRTEARQIECNEKQWFADNEEEIDRCRPHWNEYLIEKEKGNGRVSDSLIDAIYKSAEKWEHRLDHSCKKLEPQSKKRSIWKVFD